MKHPYTSEDILALALVIARLQEKVDALEADNEKTRTFWLECRGEREALRRDLQDQMLQEQQP